jgi:hypothetical protein
VEGFGVEISGRDHCRGIRGLLPIDGSIDYHPDYQLPKIPKVEDKEDIIEKD